jgi:hypothetical protein
VALAIAAVRVSTIRAMPPLPLLSFSCNREKTVHRLAADMRHR